MPLSLLNSLASTQLGYSFRTRLKPADSGFPVIQLKDLSEGDSINLETLDRTETAGFKDTHSVRAGDVVFRSRGASMRSAVVTQTNGTLILAAPLMRIRIENNSLLPQYLSWYINSPIGQNYLESVCEGSAQRMVSKQNLERMPVDVPSMEIQRLIIEIAGLSAAEARLQQEIADRRSKLITAQLTKLVKE